MILLTSFMSLIFVILAIIHLTWAIGSTWGLESALPADPKTGKVVIYPSTSMTLFVAFGLLACAFIYFINPEPGNPKNWIFDWGRVIVPVLFVLRAIGDFKYVGLTKKIKGTRFSAMDTKFYTPLCLCISALGALITRL